MGMWQSRAIMCRELSLTGSRLGRAGADALGRSLPLWPLLGSLKIDACSLNDSAAGALAAGVAGRSLPRLQNLAIGGNFLSAAGLSALADAFEKAPALRALDVSCTPLAAAPMLAPPDQDLPDVLADLDTRRWGANGSGYANGAGAGAQLLSSPAWSWWCAPCLFVCKVQKLYIA